MTFLSKIDTSPEGKEIEFLRGLTNRDLAESKQYRINVSYVLLDKDKTEYNFMQEFHLRDTQQYFSIMKEFAGNSLSDLFENKRKYHLYPTELKGNIADKLCKLYPAIDRLTPPDIYHFALYNDKDVVADREDDVRSPRIYFIVGEYGTIYPIFFDPYHELNPLNV